MKRFFLAIITFIFLTGNIYAQKQAPGLGLVGYGYDVFGKFADNASKKKYPLFKWTEYKTMPIMSDQYSMPNEILLENIGEKKKTTISTSSRRDYAKSFGASASLGVEAVAFSASVEVAYSQSSSKSKQYYFHTIRDANRIWRISIDERFDHKTLLDPMAAKDINNSGLSPEELFKRYGTHYIASAYLGGRLDYTTTTEITEKSSASEISTTIEGSYAMVTATGSVSSGNSQGSSNSKTKSVLTVTGGNAEMLSSVGSESAYENWASGIRERPVLCDFDKTSLLPIWNLCALPGRKAELEAAFVKLCEQYPLPEAMANVVSMRNEAYMVKCKDGGLYWDFSGYNMDAKQKGGKLKLWQKDGNIHENQGFDRIFKMIPHAMEPEWVHLQAQHSNYVLDITAGAEVQLWDKGKENTGQLFKLEPVDGETNTYFIKNKNSGLYFEAPAGQTLTKGTVIIQSKFTGKDNQKWVFETFNPKNIAQPKSAYYTMQCAAGGNYWDFPGSYPNIRSDKLQLWAPGPAIGDRTMKIAKRGEYFVIRPDHHPTKLLTAKVKSQLFTSKQTFADNQLFKFEYGGQAGTYLIVNKATHQAIDANAGKTKSNGCQVSVWPKHGGENQRWYIHPYKRKTPIHEGSYHVKMAKSNKYWDIPGSDSNANNKNGKSVQLWDFGSGKDRQVKFVPSDELPYYNIVFQNGNRRLDISGKWKWDTADEIANKVGKAPIRKKDKKANVQIWEKNNKDNQKWKIIPAGDGSYYIVSKLGKAVDAKGGKINENGCNIWMWDFKKSDGQKFKFIKVKKTGKTNG